MRVRILGCGTSSGVPRVGNDWGDCDPANPKNRRRRASILLSEGDTRILVDTGPDLREQLLDANISDVAAVIWTHDHADHCHGIDDLRQLFHARGAPVETRLEWCSMPAGCGTLAGQGPPLRKVTAKSWASPSARFTPFDVPAIIT